MRQFNFSLDAYETRDAVAPKSSFPMWMMLASVAVALAAFALVWIS
jgi:hypothetical protein